jgi:hypothetical protein
VVLDAEAGADGGVTLADTVAFLATAGGPGCDGSVMLIGSGAGGRA